MRGVTCQLIAKTGRAFFFNPVFTYKGPPRRSRVHTLERAVLANCIFKKKKKKSKGGGKKTKQKAGGGGGKRKKKVLLNIHGFLPPRPRAPAPSKPENWRFVAPLEKGEGAQAESRKSLLPIAGGSLNKIRFKWQEPNFCKPPRSIFWLRLKDEYQK